MINEKNDTSRRKNLFKYIYFIFNLCFILPTPICKGKNGLFKYLLFCTGILISIVHLILCILVMVSSDVQPASIADLFTVLVAVWLRVGLSWKLNSLKKLSDEISKFVFCPNIKKRYKTRIFLIGVIFTALSNIFLFALDIFTNFNEFTFLIFANTGSGNEILDAITVFFFFISSYIFCFLPVHILSIFYSLICCYLVDLFDNLKQLLVDDRNVDYDTIINSLHIIEEKVTLVNEN